MDPRHHATHAKILTHPTHTTHAIFCDPRQSFTDPRHPHQNSEPGHFLWPVQKYFEPMPPAPPKNPRNHASHATHAN